MDGGGGKERFFLIEVSIGGGGGSGRFRLPEGVSNGVIVVSIG